MRKESNRYRCRDDNGNGYVVIEYQNYRIFNPVSGPRQEVPTTKELLLSTGEPVKYIDDQTFEVVSSDKRLYRN
jgi:hypothetical protein